MRYSVYFLSLTILFFSCEEDESAAPLPSLNTAKELTTFSFLTEHNPAQVSEDLIYTVQDNYINVMFPVGQRRDSLVASFRTTAATVMIDTVVQYSDSTHNDYSQPITYTFMAEDSSTAEYEIRPHTYAGIPVVYIETDGQAPIVSKENYVPGNVTVLANRQGEEPISRADIEIRGRGNTTWKMSKKPYRFRFGQRTEVLGMPAHKVWVLLANFSDKSLLRNHVAFDLSRRFGMAYTPRSEFVDLYLNGAYQGNYQLTEQIKIDEHRLVIDEMGEENIDGDALSGGYLLEVDGRSNNANTFVTAEGIKIELKSPDEGIAEQLDYIRTYVQSAEDALFADNFTDPEQGYAQYLDVESFVNWYLINELAKNTDAKFHNSVYMHKPRNGKLTMGPVWDYDIGFGNVNYSAGEFPEGWYIRDARWIRRLWEDPAFSQRVRERWHEMKPEIQMAINQIDQKAENLGQSPALNFNTWKILGYRVWPNPVVPGSYPGEVAYLKDWLNKRFEWMDQELSQ